MIVSGRTSFAYATSPKCQLRREAQGYRVSDVLMRPLRDINFSIFGGRGGIRTHETLAGLAVFKTTALNHYATLPRFMSVK